MNSKGSMIKRIGAVGASAVILCLMAGPAFAATVSQSSAHAIDVTLAGVPLVTTGTSTATNTGTPARVTDSTTGTLQVLLGQSVANAGVLAQTAVAKNDGTSAACAGILGNGGTITVGKSGQCNPTGNAGPALINLATTPLGTLRLSAEAIYASCTASASDAAAGGFTAQSTLTNAQLIFTPVLGAPVVVNLAPGVILPPVLRRLVSLQLNRTDVTGPKTSATALHLTVRGVIGGATLADVTIGDVTCGPNALLANTPLIPAAGANLALGTIAVGGLVAFMVYRRRTAVVVR